MDILHTIIIKVASVVSAMFLFLGNSQPLPPKVTIVEVQDNKVTITESTTTKQTFLPEPTKTPSVAIVPVQPTETTQSAPAPDVTPQIAPTVQYVPVYIVQSQPAEPTAGSAPLPTNPPITMETEVKPAQILIKNPLPNKGFKEGREYRFRAEPIDESNEIQIGAILVNPDGSINNTEVMQVTASDESQNKEIHGTGNVSSFGDPDNQKYYYPYRYVFTEPGPHTITFRALGVEASIEITNVVEDTRP